MKKNKGIKILVIFIFAFTFKSFCQNATICFNEYKLTIKTITKLGDTMTYYNDAGEKFNFIFYDFNGKCYCEKYSFNKIVEKGYFTTSDQKGEIVTSLRNSQGQKKRISKEECNLPLKNGEWYVYDNNENVHSEKYILGVLQK